MTLVQCVPLAIGANDRSTVFALAPSLDPELQMKFSTLSLAALICSFAGIACDAQKVGDPKCAGYLGCSYGQEIFHAASMDGGTSDVVHQSINLGCGMAPPANTPQTVAGTPKGYLQYTVMGTGATLAGPQPMKAGPRTFWVRLPADYDPNHKYRTVYIGQGCGAYNNSENNTYTLYREAAGGDEEAIYIAMDIPQDMVNMDCYDNNSGPASQEWEAFQLFHDKLDSTYCVDNDRVYVSGYSTGGWLGNMWGCYFAGDGNNPYNGVVPTSRSAPASNKSTDGSTTDGSDSGADESLEADASAGASGAAGAGAAGEGAAGVGAAGAGAAGESGGGPTDGSTADTPPYVPTAGARRFAPQYHISVQAVTTGGEPDNNPPCNGPVAAIWIHDLTDGQNPISGNLSALARVLKMNGCTGSPTATWNPDPTNYPAIGTVCKQYTACPATHPVVFCTTTGIGHLDQHELAIPAFTDFFKLVEQASTPVAP
jgi:poly(3-hydroxybutyrate) depolymerase